MGAGEEEEEREGGRGRERGGGRGTERGRKEEDVKFGTEVSEQIASLFWNQWIHLLVLEQL